MLPLSKEIAGSALFQIRLGDGETVVRLAKHF